MSSRYAEASVSILNETVSPRSTLMFVANPWMLGSPIPVIAHSASGFPGLAFSQEMVLPHPVTAPAAPNAGDGETSGFASRRADCVPGTLLAVSAMSGVRARVTGASVDCTEVGRLTANNASCGNTSIQQS